MEGGGGHKSPILRQHSLWTAPKMAGRLNSSKFFMDSRQQKERAWNLQTEFACMKINIEQM